MSDAPHILYGMSASLFTGKARAYLNHHGIPFVERGAGNPDFTGKIVPEIGRWIIPVLVTPEGEIVQDGTGIIDHFEAKGAGRYSVNPEDPLLATVSHLFELFGGEGLLRAAMHYRWGFDDDNLAFLTSNFADAFPPGLTPEQQAGMFAHSSGRMRKAGRMFGVSDETAPTIEAGYHEFLRLFEAHLQSTYFLLGGRSTLGDYGLMNGLYAHLARDPHPSMIMKREAPRIFAWTERMNSGARDEHRVTGAPDEMFEDIPETLKDMMRFVAEDFLPEMVAHIEFTNDWLAKQDALTEEPLERSIGMAAFDWRGHSIRTAVMPYRQWLLQRLTNRYDGASAADQSRIRSLFEETGLTALLENRTARRVERRDNREYFAA